MSAWVLPDHIADVLPSEARHIEELRRSLLDTARGYGYELVMPPLLEHLESLLTGTGEALGLHTFKLVDQLFVLTKGGPDNASALLLYYIYEVAFSFWDTAYAATLTVVLLTLLIVLAIGQYVYFDRRVHYQ